MCLILFSYETHPVFKLVVAANRDEFYNRPTAALAGWTDKPDLLAGRDLTGGGTWLGVSRQGRLAALTNYRDPHTLKPGAPTRGLLVTRFIEGAMSGRRYLEALSLTADQYNGFNLIVYDRDGLWYFSNREGIVRPVAPGIHGLSNHLLDTPWPKVKRGLALFKTATAAETVSPERLLELLEDQMSPPTRELPETGMGTTWERILAPIFIKSEIYGTRASSIVSIDQSGKGTICERTYDCGQDGKINRHTRSYFFGEAL